MKKCSLNNSVLVDLSKGDSRAFELIFKTYSPIVFRRLLYFLKDFNEAEEIVQNVFIKLWDNRENIHLDKDIQPYLLKIANSLAIDLIRRNVRTQNLINSVLLSSAHNSPSAEDLYLQKEENRFFELAIDNLPPKRKEIFTLCKIEGRSYVEVGEMLSISPSTISSQLVKAVKFLKLFSLKHQDKIKLFMFFFFV